ncbi:MAG: hypothetical protein N3F10_01550 [Candidatus Bathyarchaeota archaeon]|nr:hypothetical protein [Candidatus Bathyarchaeota archaeon]MCX8176971.1 hypothetical protein [Candidatus Bathyarchaeota archaeon]MDW8194476.1 hypothetical protein [Nitrososphaerota archaeon]
MSSNVKFSIRCECGEDIPLSLDTKEMGRTIEAHALTHAMKKKDQRKAEEEFNRVQDALIKQLFELLASMK